MALNFDEDSGNSFIAEQRGSITVKRRDPIIFYSPKTIKRSWIRRRQAYRLDDGQRRINSFRSLLRAYVTLNLPLGQRHARPNIRLTRCVRRLLPATVPLWITRVNRVTFNVFTFLLREGCYGGTTICATLEKYENTETVPLFPSS